MNQHQGDTLSAKNFVFSLWNVTFLINELNEATIINIESRSCSRAGQTVNVMGRLQTLNSSDTDTELNLKKNKYSVWKILFTIAHTFLSLW